MKLLSRVLYPIYEARLMREIKGAVQPKHIAVIVDGNRRWAREAGFADVSHGHRVGAKKIGELISWCEDAEVEVELVTVYLLSTENLSRTNTEIETLYEIVSGVVTELSDGDSGCRVRLVGQLDLLPEAVAAKMMAAAEKTSANEGITVNIAVGYGGRQEIAQGVRGLIADEVAAGTAPEDLAESVTVESISTHLYTSGQPDPDLVIRTSGEQRLSGFLLWQAAYSEIWFTDTYWPAFRKVDFLRALRDFSKRTRRFGK